MIISGSATLHCVGIQATEMSFVIVFFVLINKLGSVVVIPPVCITEFTAGFIRLNERVVTEGITEMDVCIVLGTGEGISKLWIQESHCFPIGTRQGTDIGGIRFFLRIIGWKQGGELLHFLSKE